MYTVEEGHLVGAARVGGALVGQQHELLDHALGGAAIALDDVHAAAVLVHDKLCLVGLDVHAAAGLAQHKALAVQLVHGGQLVQHGGVLGLQVGQVCTLFRLKQGVDFFIHTFDAAADDALDELVAADLAVLVQTHQAGECQTILALVQGADTVGQLGRQHRNDLVGVVDAGRTLVGLLVQRRAGADIVADIRDVNTQLIAVLKLLQADGIINILRLSRVDRKDGNTAQIQTFGRLGRVDDGVIVCVSLLQHLRRKFLPDIAAVEDRLGTLGGVVRGAELFDHGGTVVAVAVAAVGDEEADLIAQMYALAPLLSQQELHITAAVRLDRHAAVLRQADRTREAVVGDSDLHDLTLRGALHTGMVEQLDIDLVVGHRAVQGAPRDKDVALAVIAAGKAEAGCQLDQCAGNGRRGVCVLIGGKARHIGAVAHRQVAGGDHSRYAGAQAGIVHLQVILQLTQRHGAALDCV